MIFALSLLAVAAAAAPEQPASRLTLKNGTSYILKEPPKIQGHRIVFTTMEGKTFSMDEKEISSIGPPPMVRTTPSTTYSTQDSRALGAIARQNREKRGKSAEVAPRPRTTPARPKRTPRPRRPPVSPTAGKALPG